MDNTDQDLGLQYPYGLFLLFYSHPIPVHPAARVSGIHEEDI